MKQLSIMMKPASAGCNMRCRYCFYTDVGHHRSQFSSGLMRRETAEGILDNIFSCLTAGDHLTLSFQGGEPTLVGLSWFESFVEQADALARKTSVSLSYAIQTNGLLLNDAWCDFLKAHQFLVGLSLDGPQQFHDQARLDMDSNGTYQRVLAAKKRLDEKKIEYNVLTVLTNELAAHPRQFWKFLLTNSIQYCQLIPCMDGLTGCGAEKWALTPGKFASFYTQLFHDWQQSYQRGQYRSVKLFDDLIAMLAYGVQNACGITGRCSAQIVVESNGKVYPCDFYVLDQYCAGNLAEERLETIFSRLAQSSFLTEEQKEMTACQDCPYLRMCGGGCKRMRAQVCCRENELNCGYRQFFRECLPQIMKIAGQIRARAIQQVS